MTGALSLPLPFLSTLTLTLALTLLACEVESGGSEHKSSKISGNVDGGSSSYDDGPLSGSSSSSCSTIGADLAISLAYQGKRRS